MSLVCPDCDRVHPGSERFCDACGLPLVHAPWLTTRRRPSWRSAPARSARATPRDRLVRVAAARHQAEAEMIQGLLLEEGIPSVAPRSGGFDVPDFLASGPRDILVAASGEEAAREILADRREGRRLERQPRPIWVRALALSLAMVPIVIIATILIAGLTFD